MPRFPLRPRLGLLGKFALASLLPIVVLGVVLAHYLAGQIESRALANARQGAVLSSRLGIQPLLTPTDLRDGLTPDRFAAFDRAIRNDLIGSDVARVKIWNGDGRVIYSDDRKLVGRRFAPTEELATALRGEVASEVSRLDNAENADDRRFGELLEVYVPLRFGGSTEPAGAFEVYLPYRPIAATIAHDTRTTYLLLLGGLALLYAVLFRIVASASKRLRRQAQENEHQALHDALTDLPNRTLFHDRARQALLTAKRDGGTVAVVIIDLDRFKDVNDTLGHQSGDLLLRALGPRLRGGAPRERHGRAPRRRRVRRAPAATSTASSGALRRGTPTRAGAREPFDARRARARDRGEHRHRALPAARRRRRRRCSAAPTSPCTSRRRAHGGIRALRPPSATSYSPERLGLLAELRRAIDHDELVLHYQPKAALADGGVAGVEALVRWQHPERGLPAPDEFVPLAEHTGLMRPLTYYVLDQRAASQCAWRRPGDRTLDSRSTSRRATCSTSTSPTSSRRCSRPGASSRTGSSSRSRRARSSPTRCVRAPFSRG